MYDRERERELLSQMPRKELEELALLHLNTIEHMRGQVDALKARLTENDRTSAFYRYHRGGKS